MLHAEANVTGVIVLVPNLKGVSPSPETSLVFQSLLHVVCKNVTEAAFSPFHSVFPTMT